MNSQIGELLPSRYVKIPNVIIFLYLSAGILSFGSFKSLQEKSYTGVMASTGLSYLSLIVSLGASGTLILSI